MKKTSPQRKRIIEEASRRIDAGETIRQLARELFKYHPSLFNNEDHARRVIRYHRGASGDEARKSIPSENVRPSTVAEGLAKIAKQLKPIERTVSLTGRIGVIADTHVPHHNVEALGLALEYLVDADIDALVLLGDGIDNYGVSRWLRDTQHMSQKAEFEAMREFLALLRELFPTQIIEYKEGNHEQRWRHYLLTNAREVADLPGMTIQDQLRLDELNIGYTVNPIIAGNLTLLHGHEFPKGMAAPVNAARGMFLRAKDSVMCGHYHATSEHAEGTLRGRQLGFWSVGCLCDLDPDFMPLAHVKWNHGFALVDVEENGSFTVRNHRIIDGVVK